MEDSIVESLPKELVENINKTLVENINKTIDNTIIYHEIRESLDIILRDSNIDVILGGENLSNDVIFNKAVELTYDLPTEISKYNKDRLMKYINLKRGTN